VELGTQQRVVISVPRPTIPPPAPPAAAAAAAPPASTLYASVNKETPAMLNKDEKVMLQYIFCIYQCPIKKYMLKKEYFLMLKTLEYSKMYIFPVSNRKKKKTTRESNFSILPERLLSFKRSFSKKKNKLNFLYQYLLYIASCVCLCLSVL
jgi:hypothetical protein